MSRRKPPSENGSLASSSTTPSTSSSRVAPKTHPFLPTALEAALLAIYPLTLLTGSLFSVLSSSTRNIAYNPTTQSHPDTVAPSYFARKKNIFNLYFVKVGWFWTTLALLLFILTHPSFGRPLVPVPTRRRVQSALRWASATAIWAAVTQWFFGPPLIDRGFRFTGGACELLESGQKARLSKGEELLTAVSCKLAGGTWRGGHDISGHVFLLILGSALLWMEVLPVVLKHRALREERVIRARAGGTRFVGVGGAAEDADEVVREKMERQEEQSAVMGLGVRLAVGVAALSWWMLLMTAAFFHTWFEKFTGFLVAFGAVWAIYFLPRGVPVLRDLVGMPAR